MVDIAFATLAVCKAVTVIAALAMTLLAVAVFFLPEEGWTLKWWRDNLVALGQFTNIWFWPTLVYVYALHAWPIDASQFWAWAVTALLALWMGLRIGRAARG